MFTGIIQKVGQVIESGFSSHGQGDGATDEDSRELQLCIDSQFSDVTLGESVAVNGVCLTVTEFSTEGRLYFHASKETLARSNLGSLRAGSPVNLERALLASDRLSGHIVQGHVDGHAVFLEARASGESFEVSFELPEELAFYCVEKGSIALDGVSLTLNRVRGREIGITLIPHTWKHTNLSTLKPGDRANVEIDVFAKYALKFAEKFAGVGAGKTTEKPCQS